MASSRLLCQARHARQSTNQSMHSNGMTCCLWPEQGGDRGGGGGWHQPLWHGWRHICSRASGCISCRAAARPAVRAGAVLHSTITLSAFPGGEPFPYQPAAPRTRRAHHRSHAMRHPHRRWRAAGGGDRRAPGRPDLILLPGGCSKGAIRRGRSLAHARASATTSSRQTEGGSAYSSGCMRPG